MDIIKNKTQKKVLVFYKTSTFFCEFKSDYLSIQ